MPLLTYDFEPYIISCVSCVVSVQLPDPPWAEGGHSEEAVRQGAGEAGGRQGGLGGRAVHVLLARQGGRGGQVVPGGHQVIITPRALAAYYHHP